MISIQDIQGGGLRSPLADQSVRVRGVVIGHGRKGFFIQEPGDPMERVGSKGLFIFGRRERPPLRAIVEVSGLVVDWLRNEDDRPTTQISLDQVELLDPNGPEIEPIWLEADTVPRHSADVAEWLNNLEGMLVGLPADSIFVAPSNPFGDYVVAPPGLPGLRTPAGGMLIDPENPQRWLPSFRVRDRDYAQSVDLGAKLVSPIVGPLSYRASSYQIEAQVSASSRLSISPGPAHAAATTRLVRSADQITILTLNGFNLDEQIERKEKVVDPARDIDDDLGDGRFRQLAQAIVTQAASPDLLAVQEFQDDDGAEQTEIVLANETYKRLVEAILRAGGPRYQWADLPPESGEDGGQPGGNIRNAYLYDPKRLTLVNDSMVRLGADHPAYEDSRKSLLARFRFLPTGQELAVVNVHLASKRHQRSLFAPEAPGHDAKLSTRVQQAELVREALTRTIAEGQEYYVTGDFNDFEFSDTLQALLGEESVNLVESLPPEQRYDYNHRGILQTLMHGIVSKNLSDRGDAEYEILHGNELLGVEPGELGTKASDHAYVIARLRLR